MFHHDGERYRLVVIGGDDVVIVVRLLIVVAVVESDVVRICKVGLRPAVGSVLSLAVVLLSKML